MIASITEVTSLDQPELHFYRSLRRSVEHRREGVFIAEGNKVVERLLASRHTVVSVLLTESWLTSVHGVLSARPEPIIVLKASDILMKSIVGFRYHQGIIAVGRIPSSTQLETICREGAPPALFVALDKLTSAENTGVIVRTAAACGAGAVIVSESGSDPYLRRSVRNSMGTIFSLPVVYSDNLADTMRTLREKHRFSIIAAHLGEKSVSLHEVDFSSNCCVVLGHEQFGVSEEILDECDTVMQIPMAEGVDSFNVGCASAIVLYEAFRQRMGVGG